MPTRWTVLTARALCAVAGLVTYTHLTHGNGAGATLSFVACLAAGAVAWVENRRPATMSKPNRKRFRLSQIREAQANKTGRVIEVETDDGAVYEIDAPGFWPDEATELMGKGREVDLATVLLGGKEKYAAFKASGGRAQDVALAISAFQDDQGVTEGESTASSAS